MSWSNIVNLEELKFEPGQGKVEAPYVYEWAPAASQLGAKKLGFNVSRLPPGQFSCPYHFHHSEEEIFIVLEGKGILRQPEGFREVVKGDLIFFSASSEGAHQFYNHTELPFTYFALSNNEELDVCEYPDSRKVNVRKLKRLFVKQTQVPYLHGEENPAQFWPAELLRGSEKP